MLIKKRYYNAEGELGIVNEQNTVDRELNPEMRWKIEVLKVALRIKRFRTVGIIVVSLGVLFTLFSLLFFVASSIMTIEFRLSAREFFLFSMV